MSKVVTSLSEIEMADYDYIVIGSDQVWNENITKENFDDFFLPFKTKAKKISLASSFGIDTFDDIPNDKLAFMKAAEINNFDSGYLLHQSKLTCIKCGARGGMVYHLKKLYTKDYLTLPLCAKCYDDVNTRGESYLQSDIKAVLNGLSLEDFCLLAYHYYRKSFSYSGTP